MAGELTNSQIAFCREYIYDWNATRAYLKAYPTVKNNNSAHVLADRLLQKVTVQDYIANIQKDLEKLSGISRQMIADEYRKIAFSSIANLHNTWIERKEFEALTEDQKASIQEIETKILQKNIGTYDKPEVVDVEFIKVKLYNKAQALDSLCKMLGYNEAEKKEIKFTGKPIKIGFEDDNDSD